MSLWPWSSGFQQAPPLGQGGGDLQRPQEESGGGCGEGGPESSHPPVTLWWGAPGPEG